MNGDRNGVGSQTTNGSAAETVTPEVLPATYPLAPAGMRGVVVPKGLLILGGGVLLGALLTLWVQSQFKRGRD